METSKQPAQAAAEAAALVNEFKFGIELRAQHYALIYLAAHDPDVFGRAVEIGREIAEEER